MSAREPDDDQAPPDNYDAPKASSSPPTRTIKPQSRFDPLFCPVCDRRRWKRFPGADRIVQHVLNHCWFLPGRQILKTLAEHLDSDFETWVGLGTLADEVGKSYVTVWTYMKLWKALDILSVQPAREKQLKVQRRADRRTINYRVEVETLYRLAWEYRTDRDGGMVDLSPVKPGDYMYTVIKLLEAFRRPKSKGETKDTGFNELNPVEAASSTPRGSIPEADGVQSLKARGSIPEADGVQLLEDDLSSGSAPESSQRTDTRSSPTAEPRKKEDRERCPQCQAKGMWSKSGRTFNHFLKDEETRCAARGREAQGSDIDSRQASAVARPEGESQA